jgi:hypothetical protein
MFGVLGVINAGIDAMLAADMASAMALVGLCEPSCTQP